MDPSIPEWRSKGVTTHPRATLFRNPLTIKINKPQPITSYGIILYTLTPVEPRPSNNPFAPLMEHNEFIAKFLISQRRDTICFIEFMKGNHNRYNIGSLISGMTQDEQQRLLKCDFDTIWDDLWINHRLKIYTQEYKKAKFCYEKIRVDLPQLIEKHTSSILAPEWGFPKGKKFQNEDLFTCALREFGEETRYKTTNLTFPSNKTFTENYIGTNKKQYRTVYYLAQSPTTLPINYEYAGMLRPKTISEELGDMKWVTLEEAKVYLQDSKMVVLNNAHTEIFKEST